MDADADVGHPDGCPIEKVEYYAQEICVVIAAHLLEVGEDELEWHVDSFRVKGSHDRKKSIQEVAFAASATSLSRSRRRRRRACCERAA